MMDYRLLDDALKFIAGRWNDPHPAAGLICGSGWSDVVASFELLDTVPYDQIPGLGAPGVVGHAGRLVRARCAGVETLVFQGRRHYYEGEGWTPVALPVYILKKLGAKTVLLTNAAGGIREDMKPGDLMVIDDHINNIGTPLIGAHNPVWGPRFPDQSTVYDPALREAMMRAGQASSVKLFHGVYLASSGPAYETPAEIHAFRTLGADAVGMSTVPEAMLARAGGLRVCGLSCITNYAAGITANPLTHEEVTEATQAAMPRMKSLVGAFWKELANV